MWCALTDNLSAVVMTVFSLRVMLWTLQMYSGYVLLAWLYFCKEDKFFSSSHNNPNALHKA